VEYKELMLKTDVVKYNAAADDSDERQKHILRELKPCPSATNIIYSARSSLRRWWLFGGPINHKLHTSLALNAQDPIGKVNEHRSIAGEEDVRRIRWQDSEAEVQHLWCYSCRVPMLLWCSGC
jgi:hypothetical protein